MKNQNLPRHMREQLEKKGYYDLTVEQRVEKNKHCFGSLLGSSKGDPKAEVEALRDFRGGYR